jgi:aerobic carbon-monoxide dehydrogenase small subunit
MNVLLGSIVTLSASTPANFGHRLGNQRGGVIMDQKHPVTLMVNGSQRSLEVEPRQLLVHALRDNLGLTGTHVGCDTSQCGACTVLVNGEAVKSCTMLTVQADGCEVTTVEGLGDMEHLHPVQEGFWEQHGLQCGFCTPGAMMTAVGLLKHNPNPSEEEIREGLEGVICRCTGYQNIVKAVQYAARKLGEREVEVEIATAAPGAEA